MNQNQRQYLQSAVQVLKEHVMEVNVKNISHFVNGVIPENIIQEWMNEQEMQALDQALDPDGLDEQGQRLWNEYEREEAIEPVEPTKCEICRTQGWVAVCLNCGKKVCEPHTGDSIDGTDYCGFLCTICSTAGERLESSAQRFQEDQADQDYWQQCSSEGYVPDELDSCPERYEPDETAIECECGKEF